MVYKQISTNYVIQKIIRDLSLNDPSIPNIVQWIGEAVEFLGTYVSLENKTTFLTVKSHRAKIPNGAVTIDSVWDKEFKTKIFYGKDNDRFDIMDEDLHDENYSHERNIYENAYYIINHPYLKFSFISGEVKIFYKTIPVDENNYPLIPDLPEYIEAIFWYVTSRMILSGELKKTGLDYEYAEQKWIWNKNIAINRSRFPSIEKMDSFKSSWLQLIPDYKR